MSGPREHDRNLARGCLVAHHDHLPGVLIVEIRHILHGKVEAFQAGLSIGIRQRTPRQRRGWRGILRFTRGGLVGLVGIRTGFRDGRNDTRWRLRNRGLRNRRLAKDHCRKDAEKTGEN